MGKYFADVHASYKSQFENLPHGLFDTDEILACRAKPQTYETLLELADALCWQLRFREAIDALTQAVKLEPERMEAYRKRGPKYLDTLQFERALADYTRCEQADGVSVMSRYRIGMAHYLMGKYGDAICAFSDSLAIAPQDDDMYIADVYWLVLSQLRAGQADEAQKTLQQHYRPDMYVGHHTAYEKAMRVAAAHPRLHRHYAGYAGGAGRGRGRSAVCHDGLWFVRTVGSAQRDGKSRCSAAKTTRARRLLVLL